MGCRFFLSINEVHRNALGWKILMIFCNHTITCTHQFFYFSSSLNPHIFWISWDLNLINSLSLHPRVKHVSSSRLISIIHSLYFCSRTTFHVIWSWYYSKYSVQFLAEFVFLKFCHEIFCWNLIKCLKLLQNTESGNMLVGNW